MARELLRLRTVGFALLAVMLVIFPFLHGWPVFSGFISEFRTFNATMFAIWLLVVLGMNLLTGYSGQISLGHAAVVLVGAYAAGVFFDQFGLPLPIAILLGGIFTGVVGGVIIGLPAVRLAGPYLAIATFSLVITLPQVLKMGGIRHWTNGSRGIAIEGGVQPPGLVDGFLDERQWLYYVTMATAVFMAVLAWNLIRSRIGRAFVALRDSEIAAEQMGINVPLYKALAFGISSFYAGIAGGLYFMVLAFISPNSLDFRDSILFLVAIVIGGLATILGSVFGALFLTFEGEMISEFTKVVPAADDLRGVIFGSLLIVVMVLFPRGLAGFIHTLSAMPARLSARLRTDATDASASDESEAGGASDEQGR